MKKLISIVLALSLLFAFGVSAYASSSTVLQTVKALGIMTGSSDGNMNLTAEVSRAELAKMLVKASSFRDDCSDNNGSFTLFTDVAKDHWANQYIYTCVKNGWLLAYSDDSFRPSQSVLIEELCAAVVRILGYQAKDLSGAYPNSYINKAKSLGLLDRVSLDVGQKATRQDCANIIYNMLCAKTSDGKAYAETIGCSVSNGQIDYSKSFDTSADGIYYGVVKKNTKQANNNTSEMERNLTVICSDGITRNFYCPNCTLSTLGSLVSVNVNGGTASVSCLGKKSAFGKINSEASKWGLKSLADNIQVLDTDEFGNAVSVDISRLAGNTLKLSDVRYYAENSSGAVSVLVLNDYTGDLWSYGYCLYSDLGIETEDITIQNQKITLLTGAPSTYKYFVEGKVTELNTENLSYLITKGGIAIKYETTTDETGRETKTIDAMRQLAYTELNALNSKTAQTKKGTYDISEDAKAYIKQGSNFYEVNIGSIDTSKYQVFGYYDPQFSKEIKIIICFDIASIISL